MRRVVDETTKTGRYDDSLATAAYLASLAP
jgi:hypothetical protein